MRIREFITGQGGAVSAEWILMVSAAVAVTLGAAAMTRGSVGALSGDIGVALSNEMLDPEGGQYDQSYEVYILSLHWHTRSGDEQVELFHAFVDPENCSRETLRATHRDWTDLAGDPNFDQSYEAFERAMVLQMAMDARGVEPYPGY